MSAFRSLAPSTQPEDSSASSPNKYAAGESNSGTSGTTSGGGNSGGADQGAGSGGDGKDGNPRKRRTAGSVSTMACTPCRQARQRCDGNRPNRCGRCALRKLDCIYKPHTKTHKDDLIQEIKVLRGDNTDLQNRNREIEQSALEVDSTNRGLREEGAWQRIILQTIGSNGHDREIIKKLRAGESHQSIADWLVHQNPDFGNLGADSSSRHDLVDVVQIFEAQCQGDDGLERFSPETNSELRWTKVCTSQKLVGHLFDLYFTWVHPVHMLFSEMDFKIEFRHNLDTYCSRSLVNAICAMACHLLDGENERGRRNVIDAATLRDGFMAEARTTLTPETFSHMTSIQSFAIMYLVELSSGKARSAVGYLRSAVENLKTSSGPQQSDEAKEVTFWGIQTLNTYVHSTFSCRRLHASDTGSSWKGVTYQRLWAPPAPQGPIFQNIQLDADDRVWRFYRRPGDARELPFRPSHGIMTACQQAELFSIINESIGLYCGARGKVSAAKMLEVYGKYKSWKDDLPGVIANIGEGDQPLPHILYLHAQYHTALVQHFSPLLHCGAFTGSDLAELRQIVIFHARSGVEPLEHSRRLYSSRFSLPLMSFCLIHLCDALVRYSPQVPPAAQTARFCLDVLHQTRLGFALCGPLQSLFYQAIRECGVQLPPEMSDTVDSFNHYVVDDILDVCTRLSYTQPLDQILHHIDPQIAQDWAGEWEKQIKSRIGKARRESTSGRYLQVANILND
ncbi:hypothetical protein N7G274_006902 [Stereocaulon virgatum]|uniref:Zn(2)-C6 fungal-type domain-containing protein n=1 Tax=Stereocaulon virgatum TaxID=373712 RepID=A0ABR4A6S5_9LECA